MLFLRGKSNLSRSNGMGRSVEELDGDRRGEEKGSAANSDGEKGERKDARGGSHGRGRQLSQMAERMGDVLKDVDMRKGA